MKSTLLLLIATSCVVSLQSVPAQSPILLQTFNNPNPAFTDGYSDLFGTGIALMGNDRVIIGAYEEDSFAPEGGVVYLFRTNGSLLTTITNPSPAHSGFGLPDQFGAAVTAVGDHILVGSPREGVWWEGRTYLYTTNGTLVMNFPGDGKGGTAVVALGADRVLIGSPDHTTDPDTGEWAGTAHMFSTNGTLLMTFDNPGPQSGDQFGFSLAAFGSDRVLVGAIGFHTDPDPEVALTAGAAFLFNTNGTLLMTFTNPTPANGDYFGNSVAAVGADRVLVGAPFDDSGGTDVGAAYLFSTNGTLLLTITNPTPVPDDRFGARIATLGNGRVIINASSDDTGETNAGSAYVFDYNGNLLATLNNPAPTTDDFFGWRIAANGGDTALIAAPWSDTKHVTDAGSAFLFSIPFIPAPPSLTIYQTAPNNLVVSWPSPSTGFVLQQNTNGLNSVNWSNIIDTVSDDGTNKTFIVNPLSSAQRFYRLKLP